MSGVLPGKPELRLQGLATAYWGDRHVNAYISGGAIAILEGSHTTTQTIYDDADQPLVAVVIDEHTGKIAAGTLSQVRVYRPLGLRDQALKWALESSFDIPSREVDASAVALSWGSSEELLVAAENLDLFSTRDDPTRTWSKKLPSPVRAAALSPDSAYIISIGHHDSLPKVWRRLAYGEDDVRFDLTYLRHPNVVTATKWRRPFHIDQAAENVLYTICLDSSVRIWVPTDTTDGQHWQLWGSVDIGATPRQGLVPHDVRVAFIVDGRDFTISVERAVKDRMADDSSTDDVALDHLVAIANKNPEICIAIDSHGLMSAWAFENIHSSTVGSEAIFSIAQLKSKRFETLGGLHVPNSRDNSHIQIQSYCERSSGELHILMHLFDGRIGVFAPNVADLLDPTLNDGRLPLRSVWSGHSHPIEKINRNYSGQAIVSRTGTGEIVVWKHHPQDPKRTEISLSRQCVVPVLDQVRRVCVFQDGSFVVFLQDGVFSLWDTQARQARCLHRKEYQVSGEPLCLITLPRSEHADRSLAHVATITSECCGIVWQVNLPRNSDGNCRVGTAKITEFCRFKLDAPDGFAYVLAVDPAGSTPATPNFLDIFARDIAISYTKSGRVQFWAARLNIERGNVDWLLTSSTETGIADPALVSGSMLKKAAMVNPARSQLTIWDVGGSRLEFEAKYEPQHVIQDLDWTATPDLQSVLAVGFRHRVLLLCQMRFDYLNRGPAWAPIREILTRELTPHPIGDSTWLSDGHLVIGAGNQLLAYDRHVNSTESIRADIDLSPKTHDGWDLFEAVQRLNGPLPFFHPQFLSQCMMSGKNQLVQRILLSLHRVLRYHISDETIDDYLGMDLTEVYLPQAPEHSSSSAAGLHLNGQTNGENGGDDADEQFSESTASSMVEKLGQTRLPQLSVREQGELIDIVKCASTVERHRRSLDNNGIRFMLFYRQHALRKTQLSNRHLSWREINWASHSSSQDILAEFIRHQSRDAYLWEHARESGIFMWLSDANSLKAQFEVIARNEYTKFDDRDPTDCSLFYLALGKKAVLQGLWRMANSNKEQAATQRLLSNNFDDPRWRTAALKNAYALLSKRRFAYAVAFFLLARDLDGAVDVCLRQLKDTQLAIALCRVWEGDSGPVLKRVLQDDVLPLAAIEGDRWLASWAFWMLGRRDMAVRALIMPVHTLLETPCAPDLKSRMYLVDDPALVVLYAQLRQKTLQTLRGASKITPQLEWAFVLHSAKIYDRMGCDLLALDLVRNWEFQRTSTPAFGGDVNPLKLLRRRSSLIVDDRALMHKSFAEASAHASKETTSPPSFHEPDALSLLDSFGF